MAQAFKPAALVWQARLAVELVTRLERLNETAPSACLTSWMSQLGYENDLAVHPAATAWAETSVAAEAAVSRKKRTAMVLETGGLFSASYVAGEDSPRVF